MNLFILSLIQKEIAQYMMDKHVSKILLEAVQMLCSCKRILDPEDETVNVQIYRLKTNPTATKEERREAIITFYEMLLRK